MPNLMRFKHDVVLLLLLLSNLLSSSSAKSNGVCVSPGGRFHPFNSEGKPPGKARDLTLCRIFRRKTCCDVSQTHNALLSVRKLATTGEADQDCLQLWELLECSICDPRIGVQPGLPVICSSFCDRVFQACSTAYFSMNAKTQVISPCGVNDFVCGRASEWVSNGTDLCQAAGFSVKKFEDGAHSEEISCYGGKASLDSIRDSWKESKSGNLRKDDSFGVPEDFQQWVREMPFRERVSWAVGGLVLTAGLFKRRKSYIQQQAAVYRTVDEGCLIQSKREGKKREQNSILVHKDDAGRGWSFTGDFISHNLFQGALEKRAYLLKVGSRTTGYVTRFQDFKGTNKRFVYTK
ncbi:hypothetical protein V2J09_019664 [Rumex salicifolius]